MSVVRMVLVMFLFVAVHKEPPKKYYCIVYHIFPLLKRGKITIFVRFAPKKKGYFCAPVNSFSMIKSKKARRLRETHLLRW